MADIQNREHIHELVREFYAQVREDELLGPIFAAHIADDEWDHHFDLLTDFWSTNLLGPNTYSGSPTRAHAAVDKAHDHAITQLHFHRWLLLWVNTVDRLYAGTIAERAKAGARKFATGQYLAILKFRGKNQPQ